MSSRSIVLTALLTLAWSRAVRAQNDVALDRYQPSAAGDALFALPDPSAQGPVISGRVDFSYSRTPLVVVETTAGSERTTNVVAYQAVSHQLLSLRILDRLLLHLDLPVTWSQGGDSPAGSDLPSPSGRAIGDLRLGGRLGLLRQVGLVPGAALTGTVFLPTGDEGQYTGAGHVRYAVGAAAGADYRRLLVRLFLERKTEDDVRSALRAIVGDTLGFGAGVALKTGAFSIGPELYGSVREKDPPEHATNLEALLGARYRVGPFVLGAAGGPGLTRAAGTPRYRLIASVAIAPEIHERPRPAAPKPSFTVAQLLPAPPARSEQAPITGRPEAAPDRDHDGVPDALDLCVDVPGEASPTAKRRGCPLDSDGDGIADVDDRCPTVPGVPSTDEARHGCPPDTDGDGIVDREDACPNERGPATDDAKTNGCPRSIRVEGAQIVILQQVNFATGSDLIDTSSDDLLGQFVRVMGEHPEIARVGVDGHTDDVGGAKKNLSLSRRRAVSVVRWLVEHGVDERRLEARGFGPRRPLVPNTSSESRAKNRRVEFTIVKRSESGAAGWQSGSSDE